MQMRDFLSGLTGGVIVLAAMAGAAVMDNSRAEGDWRRRRPIRMRG